MSAEAFNHPRYAQAIWYAWGQQDAGIGRNVDAYEFALAHAGHAVRFEAGEAGSHLPSIQDAWKTFIAPRHEITTTYGRIGLNSGVPKARAHCKCGWESKRVEDVTAATILGEQHVEASS